MGQVFHFNDQILMLVIKHIDNSISPYIKKWQTKQQQQLDDEIPSRLILLLKWFIFFK